MMESNNRRAEQPFGGDNLTHYDALAQAASGVQGEITSPVQASAEIDPQPEPASESVSTPHEQRAPGDREVRAPYSTLPMLPFAEQVGRDALRGRLDELRGNTSTRRRMETASVLTELAIASPDVQESAQAFTDAEAMYADLIAEAEPYSQMALRAHRYVAFLPVMRQLRSGIPAGRLSSQAHSAALESLDYGIQGVGQYAERSSVPDHIVNAMTVDSVAALLARVGWTPFPASDREHFNNDPGRRFMLGSDLYLRAAGGQKVSIKTHYNTAGQRSRPDDRTKIVSIRYLPNICRPVARALLQGGPLSTQQEARMAVDLSWQLLHEGTDAEQEHIRIGSQVVRVSAVLDRASGAAARKVRQWQYHEAAKNKK